MQTDHQNNASLPDTHADLQDQTVVNTNYLYSIPMQTMETESLPLNQCDLQLKVDSLQNDLFLLRKECLSWKAAFTDEVRKNEININELMEVKSSLSTEQKKNEILLSTLHSATEDSLKMKEEVEKLLSESAEKMTKLQEERDKSALTQINLTKITQDFDELRKLLLEQDNVIKKIKSKNKQYKSLCEGYKKKSEILSEGKTSLKATVDNAVEVEDKLEQRMTPEVLGNTHNLQSETKKQTDIKEDPVQLNSSISVMLVDFVKLAENISKEYYGKRCMVGNLASIKDQMRQLTDSLKISTAEVEKLKNENEVMKKTSVETETSFTDILKQAKKRILHLTEIAEKYRSDTNQYKYQLENLEKKFEADILAKEVALKNSYEDRLLEVESLKNEKQNELNQMQRKVELLSLKVNALQHLSSLDHTMSTEDCDEGSKNSSLKVNEQSSIVFKKSTVSSMSTPLNTMKSDFVDPSNAASLLPEYKHVNFCDSKQNSKIEPHQVGLDVRNIYSNRQNCGTLIHTQAKKQKTFAVASNPFKKFQISNECTLIKENKTSFKQRMKSNSSKSADKPRLIYCFKCNLTFSTKVNLKKHFCRPEPKLFSCNLCPKLFKKMKDLLLHECHKQNKHYSCSHCNRSFSKRSHLERHIRTC